MHCELTAGRKKENGEKEEIKRGERVITDKKAQAIEAGLDWIRLE